MSPHYCRLCEVDRFPAVRLKSSFFQRLRPSLEASNRWPRGRSNTFNLRDAHGRHVQRLHKMLHIPSLGRLHWSVLRPPRKRPLIVPISKISSTLTELIMCTPRMRSVLASDRTLTMPSASLMVFARLLAAIGNLPALYAIPSCFSCSSDLPIHETSGWV